MRALEEVQIVKPTGIYIEQERISGADNPDLITPEIQAETKCERRLETLG